MTNIEQSLMVFGGMCAVTIVVIIFVLCWAWCDDFITKIKAYKLGLHHAEQASKLEIENIDLKQQIKSLNQEIEAIKQGRPYR